MANNNMLTMTVQELQAAHVRNAKLIVEQRAELAVASSATYRAAIRRFLSRATQINIMIELRIAAVQARQVA
jgi:hypothetical protein